MSNYTKNLLLGYTCKDCKYLRIGDEMTFMLECLWHPFKDIKLDSSICRFFKFDSKNIGRFL